MSEENINSTELRVATAREECGWVIHRHDMEHTDDLDCECYPLVLTQTQIRAHTNTSLQEILDQHYRVH